MTKTEQDLAAVEAEIATLAARKTSLETKKAAEAAALAADTENVRQLAVLLHNQLCTLPHDDLARPWENCPWKDQADCDDASACNWAEASHKLWLERARGGIAALRAVGFTVTDPDEA